MEFGLTYEAMLARAWNWVAAGTGEPFEALKRESLGQLIAARLSEVMSFALAAAVLAERIGSVAERDKGEDLAVDEAPMPAEAEADVVEPKPAVAAAAAPVIEIAPEGEPVGSNVGVLRSMRGHAHSARGAKSAGDSVRACACVPYPRRSSRRWHGVAGRTAKWAQSAHGACGRGE